MQDFIVLTYLKGVRSNDGVRATVVANLVLNYSPRDAKSWDEVRVCGSHFRRCILNAVSGIVIEGLW